MKKVLPYIYIIVGVVVLFSAISGILQDKNVYRVLFNFKTENKYLFFAVRLLFASWFLVDGIKKLKQNNEA